ncbi:hypothetical protein GCM10020254_57170 [Streptomyces goshikiensis]
MPVAPVRDQWKVTAEPSKPTRASEAFRFRCGSGTSTRKPGAGSAASGPNCPPNGLREGARQRVPLARQHQPVRVAGLAELPGGGLHQGVRTGSRDGMQDHRVPLAGGHGHLGQRFEGGGCGATQGPARGVEFASPVRSG